MKGVTRSIITTALSLYQRLISPLLGNRCRFYPSCSEYAKDAFHHHELLNGAILSTTRLIRCNPLAEGGFDPVPKTTQVEHIDDNK